MNNFINKITLKIVMFIVLGGALLAKAQYTTSGGAGVRQYGEYKTFYSAGIRVVLEDNYQKEKGKSFVPGLNELIDFIHNDSMFFTGEKSEILNALIISSRRNYFDIDSNWLSPAERERIINEFVKVTKQKSDDIRLYAVTDTNTGNTFLFPEFYKLQTIEQQMTILYHEARWMISPFANYNSIVEKEIAFQGYLENPKSVDRALDLIRTHSDGSTRILALLYKKDQELGNITSNGYFKNGSDQLQITLYNLMGKDFFDCIEQRDNKGKLQYYHSYLEDWLAYPNCRVHAIYNSEKIANRFPNSYIMKRFRYAMYNKTFVIDIDGFGANDNGVHNQIEFRNEYIGYKSIDRRLFEDDSINKITLKF